MPLPALLPNQSRDLGLEFQASEHGADAMRYTISIEARDGVSTGISAADRAQTIRVAANYHSRPESLVTPGHIFPAVADVSGLMANRGWAEAGIDLARISGLRPVTAFCQVLDDDGELAQGDALLRFAEDQGLPAVTVDGLIAHRMATESFVSLLTQSNLPTRHGDFLSRVFEDTRDGRQHLALSLGSSRVLLHKKSSIVQM